MTTGPPPDSVEPESAAPIRRDRPTVVVTGMGAVTAYGWSSTALDEGLFSGRSGIGRAKNFPVVGHRTSLVSEVDAPPPHLERALRGAGADGRADQFALAAAWEAVGEAGLAMGEEGAANDVPGSWPERCGVFFSGSTAGMAEAERYFFGLLASRAAAAPWPRLRSTRSHTLNAPGDLVARRLQVRGPVVTVSSACASGTLAFGLALQALRSDEVDVAIVGGSDALCQLTYSGFNALRAVDEAASRPFRAERAGLTLGEGAAVLVLERLADAQNRGATPLARLCGAGASCDAHHMTAPVPSGDGAAAAARRALRDASIGADRIDFINAHGTGTPQNDIAEWSAYTQVFEERAAELPLTSTKGAIGHLLGAAGVVEAVATVQCLRRGQVHPTCGTGVADSEIPCDLVVDRPRLVGRGSCALSTNLAFGGANAAVVLADWIEPAA